MKTLTLILAMIISFTLMNISLAKKNNCEGGCKKGSHAMCKNYKQCKCECTNFGKLGRQCTWQRKVTQCDPRDLKYHQ